jgi:hypothetical protein
MVFGYNFVGVARFLFTAWETNIAYCILESDHLYATTMAVEESTHQFQVAAFEEPGAVYIRYGC